MAVSWVLPDLPAFLRGELLIDREEDRTPRAVLVGMLRELNSEPRRCNPSMSGARSSVNGARRTSRLTVIRSFLVSNGAAGAVAAVRAVDPTVANDTSQV